MAQTINVNTNPESFPATLYFSQGDIGREFDIVLASSDGYAVPAGATVTMVATKPSGFGFSVTGTLTNNVASFVTTETMTNEAGRFPAEIRIEYNGDVIGTANFYLDGEPDPHPADTIDGDAETIIPELTVLVERVESAASSVLDMQVVATTLPAGSDATYSYDEETNTATFGIPKGADGTLSSGVLAPTYSTSATYAVGDYVYYSGSLYRCTTAITTAESWTSGHWTQVALAPEVTDLKSDFNGITTGSRNLFNLRNAYITAANTAVEVLSSDSVKIISTNNANKYKYAEWFIDVRNHDYITVTYDTITGTGDKYVRLSWSSDGITHGDWIGIASKSPTTFDVSSYDYVGIALYAVLATNTGIGNYMIYNKLMVEYGKGWSDYVNGQIANDVEARDTANANSEQIELLSNLEKYDILNGAVWEQGTLDANGNNNGATNRIRTANFLPIPNTVDHIEFTIDSGYLYVYCFYDKDFAKKYNITVYQSVPNELPIPSGAKYLRVAMKNSTDSTGDVAWASHVHSVCSSKFRNEIVNLIGGAGTSVYTGEEISLKTLDRNHYFDIQMWLDANSTDVPAVVNYRTYAHQSLAIYGGYVFVFFGNGGGIVIDYDTKDIISGFTSEPTAHNHQNSAQFTDYFYDAADEFPIIALSRCGNASPSDPQTAYDSCLFYRITKSGTTFTFTLINTLKCNVPSYGSDWAIDLVHRTITMVSYKNGTYDVTVDNPIGFYSWTLPSKANIMSGTEITLNYVDCINLAQLDNYVVLQSACAFGGKIYFGAQIDSARYVYVMDLETGLICAKVRLVNSHELEGVTIYDGKMYVSHRNGSSQSEAEPLAIYELDF